MVDSTSTEILIRDVIVPVLLRADQVTAISFSNSMSLMRLRHKGATKVTKLPSGVFRRILEYYIPTELCCRYSEPCGGPIEDKQDYIHFSAIDKLDYDNYLVAVNEITSKRQFQFTLLDGASCGSGGSGNNWTSLQIS